jgi:hypothetical protein
MQKVKVIETKSTLAIIIEGSGQISDFNKDVDRLYSYLYHQGFRDKIAGPLIGIFYTEFGGKYIAAVPIKEKILLGKI